MADPKSTKTNTPTIPTQEQWPLAERLEIKGWEDCEFRALVAEQDDYIFLVSACLELAQPIYIERLDKRPDEDLFFIKGKTSESDILPLFSGLFDKTPLSETLVFTGCTTILSGAAVSAEGFKFLVTKRSEEGEELREI